VRNQLSNAARIFVSSEAAKEEGAFISAPFSHTQRAVRENRATSILRDAIFHFAEKINRN
jgi:hypothetical protein